MLPSFLYLPSASDFPAGSLTLPWADNLAFVAGTLARVRGAEAPGRLNCSAKSWLCHVGVDRTAPILPWGGAEDLKKMSPLEVASQYMLHIRQAWNSLMASEQPEAVLESQDILLTVPASFDAAARENGGVSRSKLVM